MPNLLLTHKCLRSCPYCFAQSHRGEKDEGFPEFLCWEDLIYLADLQAAEGKLNISLLGGEPTLHPDFMDFLFYLFDRSFMVTVFTSGMLSDTLRRDLKASLRSIDREQLHFVCNINDPDFSPAPEQVIVKAFLEDLGEFVVPGFTIYRSDFSLDFIFQLINRHGLRRDLRLGLSHPIVGIKNAFIEKDAIKGIAKRLSSYFPLLERLHIKPGLDCGFPLCSFSDADLGWLSKFSSQPPGFLCNPVLDIGPDMSVWSCFPLSGHYRRTAYEFNTFDEMYRYFASKHEAIRAEAGGIYEECDDCVLRKDNRCAGGCIAHLLSIFTQEAPVRLSEVYS
jgi:hypothetical protein